MSARSAIAAALDDPDGAQRYSQRADRLYERFNDLFWSATDGFYISGLDGHQRPIRVLTSQVGRILDSGLAPPDRAAASAAQLVSPELFTGCLIRTLTTANPAYDPLRYHRGAAWPHDTVRALRGLRRASQRDAYQVLADGLFQMFRVHGDGPVNEVYSGRTWTEQRRPPDLYPSTTFPQAWAAGAVRLFIAVVLGLEPDVEMNELRAVPRLPRGLNAIKAGIWFAGRRISITADHASDRSVML